jgi:hypothetical protein
LVQRKPPVQSTLWTPSLTWLYCLIFFLLGKKVNDTAKETADFVKYLLQGSGAEHSIDYGALRRDLEREESFINYYSSTSSPTSRVSELKVRDISCFGSYPKLHCFLSFVHMGLPKWVLTAASFKDTRSSKQQASPRKSME